MKYALFSFLVFFSCSKKGNTDYKKLEVRNVQIKLSPETKSALNFLATTFNPLTEIEDNNGSSTYIVKSFIYFDLAPKGNRLIVKKTTYFQKELLLSNKDRRSDIYYIIPLDNLIEDNITFSIEQDKRGLKSYLSGERNCYVNIETLYQKPINHIQVFYSTDDGNKVESTTNGDIKGALSFNFRNNAPLCEKAVIALKSVSRVK